MNAFLQSPTIAAVATVLGVAALIVLHRLRAQFVRRTVATTMFWQAAARQQTPNVLWARFARWGTFLFLLLILSLMGVALSGINSFGPSQRVPYIVVIDLAYSMSATTNDGGTRLDAARQQVSKAIESQGNPIAIIAAGSSPRVIATDSEPAAVIRERLAKLVPERAPSAPAEALQLAINMLPINATDAQLRIFTDRPIAGLEMTADFQRRTHIAIVGESRGNSAILSAIYQPDDSAPSTGSLNVRVKAWQIDGSFPTLQVRLSKVDSDNASVVVPVQLDERLNEGVAIFNDVASDGENRLVELIGDDGGLTADDRLEVKIPRVANLVFTTTTELPATLRAALETIGTFAIAPLPGSIPVVIADSDASSTALPSPAIVLVSHGRSVDASSISIPVTFAAHNRLTAGLTFDNASVRSLTAIGAADTESLILAGDQAIAAIARRPEGTQLILSQSIFKDDSQIITRPGFLLLLERACREIAGHKPAPISVSLSRVAKDPTWLSPDAASIVVAATGDRSASNLVSPNQRLAQASTVAAFSSSFWTAAPWWWVVSLIAFALLVVEAILSRLRRIA